MACAVSGWQASWIYSHPAEGIRLCVRSQFELLSRMLVTRNAGPDDRSPRLLHEFGNHFDLLFARGAGYVERAEHQ